MGNQVIIFIVFGVIALINYLVRQGASTPPPRKPTGSRPGPPSYSSPSRPQIQPAQQSDDERLRKFMEALGVPAGSAQPPRKIVRPQAAPPAIVRPVVRKQARVPSYRQPTPPPPRLPAAVSTPAEDYEVTTTPSSPPAVRGDAPIVQQASAATDLKSLLQSSSSIRTAVLLREILGSPKALQTADVIPGLR